MIIVKLGNQCSVDLLRPLNHKIILRTTVDFV